MVTSTYIIIVRGRRACLWGSLYLDDYDEEDRDLKLVYLINYFRFYSEVFIKPNIFSDEANHCICQKIDSNY